MKYGLIAGNGRFPILALEAARELGFEMVAIGIKEEAPNEMCGQVRHVNIFSSIRPDWRLLKLLTSLKEKNTDALIGGVRRVLEDEGIRLVDSTLLLKPLLAGDGPLAKRKPSSDETRDLEYGRRVANALAGFDIGQSVAIAERACVAVEAMEGTDAMLRRAAALANGKALRLVKVSKRRQHMLFDVPVAGPGTIATMEETGATALAIDAGRTLLLDREELLRVADRAGIAVVGYRAEE
jgi:UDP-2,3-diacylglucosamine hydrolase